VHPQKRAPGEQTSRPFPLTSAPESEADKAGSVPESAPAERCFHCGRDVYGLQTIGERRVCGRSDCLRAALAAADLERAA
jgi:hypothetical protein